MIENYNEFLHFDPQFKYVFFLIYFFSFCLNKSATTLYIHIKNNPCQKDIESTLWLHDCKLIDILLIESSNVY